MGRLQVDRCLFFSFSFKPVAGCKLLAPLKLTKSYYATTEQELAWANLFSSFEVEYKQRLKILADNFQVVFKICSTSMFCHNGALLDGTVTSSAFIARDVISLAILREKVAFLSLSARAVRAKRDFFKTTEFS